MKISIVKVFMVYVLVSLGTHSSMAAGTGPVTIVNTSTTTILSCLVSGVPANQRLSLIVWDQGETFATADAGGTAYFSLSLPHSKMTCGTLYEFECATVSSTGAFAALSSNGTITRPSCGPPLVATAVATAITKSSVTFNSSLSSLGSGNITAFGYNYGPTSSYGNTVSATIPTATSTSLSSPLISVAPGTTYHYRVFATNADGTTYGNDVQFTTPGVGPAMKSNSAIKALSIVPVR